LAEEADKTVLGTEVTEVEDIFANNDFLTLSLLFFVFRRPLFFKRCAVAIL
jgi:hypothetical protein